SSALSSAPWKSLKPRRVTVWPGSAAAAPSGMIAALKARAAAPRPTAAPRATRRTWRTGMERAPGREGRETGKTAEEVSARVRLVITPQPGRVGPRFRESGTEPSSSVHPAETPFQHPWPALYGAPIQL